MERKMKKSFKKILVFFMVFSMIVPQLSGVTIAHAVTNVSIFNNDRLKFGNGTEASVNAKGTLNQPFYYDSVLNGGGWYKLTYSINPLNYAIGVGGDGTSQWNKNGTILSDQVLTNQVIDTSAYVPQSGNKGYGTIVSTGNVTVGSKLLEVKNTYTFGADKSFIKATTRVTNKSGADINNIRYWIGTQDDWVGTSDAPTKTRGNIVNGVFTPITNMADPASALRISSAGTGVLFYSTKPNSNTIFGGRPFSGSYNTNPATTPITGTGDQSYAMYIRLNDLANDGSDEFTWYYAAGELDNLASIADQVGEEAEAEHVTVPDSPTGVTAVAGDGQAIVSFVAPVNNGGATITGYTVTTTPGAVSFTGTASPITVTGLTNGTTYTFTVKATNSAGDSLPSIASLEVTPMAQKVILAENSLGTAEDRKITGLTAGSKYKVIVGGETKYVKEDGTLSASESDVSSLIGTEITGLTNGITYDVKEYTIFQPGESEPPVTTPTGVMIQGIKKVGNTLTAKLVKDDAIFTTSGAVTYNWYRLESQNSEFVNSIGTNETYALTGEDLGKYIGLTANYAGKKYSEKTEIITGDSPNTNTSIPAPVLPISNSSSSSSSSSSSNSTSNTEEITVKVTDGKGGNSISQVKIERTTKSDGTKKDTVNYTESKAQETIEQLAKEGRDTARIVIPDPKNEVSETKVNIPSETLSTLSSGNVNLEISTENARISLPKQTIQGLSQNGNEDLYFNLVPIKDAAKKQEIQANANREAVIQVVSGSNSVQALGSPIAIETNMSGRQVDITLPLKGINIPSDPTARQAFLNDLGIYIEHSDGTKEFVKGEIVEYETGVYGVKFSVTKFSNFTIVKLNQPSESWQNSAQGWKYIMNGQPVTGWKQVNGAWYLMDSTGIMQTGWKQDNGTWYLLRDNGSMATGWLQSNGLWYFLENSGAMATGWRQDNGQWYYLYSNGSMASNTVIDGYTLGENGAWIQ